MSETLIASLQQRITELTGENANLKSEAKDRRIKGKGLQQQIDALTAERDKALADVQAAIGERDKITGERDDLNKRLAAAPNDLQTRIEELQGKLRDRDHRDAFRKLADAAKIRPEAVDDLYQLSGYTPEGDDVDEARITGLIGDAVKARPWLVQPVETTTTEPGGSQHPITTPQRNAGPGAGKGDTTVNAPATAIERIDAQNGNRKPGRIA